MLDDSHGAAGHVAAASSSASAAGLGAASAAAAPVGDEAKVFIEIFGLPVPKLIKLAPNVKFGRVLKQIGRNGRLYINGSQELADADTPATYDLPIGSKHLTRILFEEAASPPMPPPGGSAAPSHLPTPRSGEVVQVGPPLVPARVESYQPVVRPGTPPSDHRRKSPPMAVAAQRSERFAMLPGNSAAPSSVSATQYTHRAATFSNSRGGSTPTGSPVRNYLVEHETQTSRHGTPNQAPGSSSMVGGLSRVSAATIDARTPMQRAVEAQYHPHANAMRTNLVQALNSSPQEQSSHVSNVSRVSPGMNVSGPGRGVQRRPIPSNHAHGDTVVPHIPWPSEVSVAKEVVAGAPGLQGVSNGLYFNTTPSASTRASTAAAATPVAGSSRPLASASTSGAAAIEGGKIFPAATMTPSTQLSRLNVSPISHRTRDDHFPPTMKEHDHNLQEQHLQASQQQHGGATVPASSASTSVQRSHQDDGNGDVTVELLRQQQQLNSVIGTLLQEIQALKRDAEEERNQRKATEKQLSAVMKLVQQQAATVPEPYLGPVPVPVPLSGGRSASSAPVEAKSSAAARDDDQVLEEHLKLMEELRGQRRANARPKS